MAGLSGSSVMPFTVSVASKSLSVVAAVACTRRETSVPVLDVRLISHGASLVLPPGPATIRITAVDADGPRKRLEGSALIFAGHLGDRGPQRQARPRHRPHPH